MATTPHRALAIVPPVSAGPQIPVLEVDRQRLTISGAHGQLAEDVRVVAAGPIALQVAKDHLARLPDNGGVDVP